MIAYSAMSGAVPWLVRSLVDDVFQNRNERMLTVLPVLIVVVFVARAGVNFGQAYLNEWVGESIVYDLRARLHQKVQRLPVSFFDRTSSATIVSGMTTDVQLVRQALTEGAASVLRDVTTMVVLVAVAFHLDPVLSVIAFFVLPLIVLPLQALSRKMRSLSRRGLDTLGGLSALLLETVQGARVVKAFGMQEYERGRFEGENRRLRRLHLRAARIGAFTAPMTEVLAAVGIAAVLWYGGRSVFAGGRTAGGFLAFMTTLVLIYDPFKKLARTNNLVQAGLGAADRVFALLDHPEETVSPADASSRTASSADACAQTGIAIDGLRTAIRFEKVSFSYNEIEVLHDLELEVRAGEVVALVGPSGGGKTTIADLIPRFYDASAGRITIDGTDVRDLKLDALRSLIAVVTQTTFLFNDTVRANIAYGRADRVSDDAVVVAAAEAAFAHEFIVKLADGYDTVVGELGVQLSGGQRQRIAIARALLKDAPILILDEATSALDSESERAVQAAIERLMTGRTTLVIAHRMATIRRADRILVVEDGRIVESGTHDELIEGGALYRRLHELELDREADR
ncbi:MAG TPA: ABC transporter transmembrane domain-containing protein [Candidatus Limnocylindrales bacterium]|nr:ABC transporter transmembrane domain-containing protein [Candidatus Limnocylindrales bacterium]